MQLTISGYIMKDPINTGRFIYSWDSVDTSAHHKALLIINVAIKLGQIKSLLTPEELILIEILNSVDEEHLTPEFIQKRNVLHRFIKSLV